MAAAVEIIPNKLYWISDKTPPKNQPFSYYFCIDNELVYQPFCSDFGPLNLGMTYKFCVELDRMIKTPVYAAYKIYHYTSLVPSKRVNSAYLMGAFQIIMLSKSAEEAFNAYQKLPSFVDFRDAGYGGCTYKCTLLSVLKGLEYAIHLNWFSMKSFNLKEYEHFEKVENGDWNWIIPKKMIAFACPNSSSTDSEGMRTWTPENYARLFHEIGITAVVRLNNVTYDANRFRRLGINHYDLYFLDGSVPSEDIVSQFLAISEREKAIAVHCKAGLGRTGTLIGCYAMKHFNFKADEFIGYVRLCRPGSVLGPQQQFLVEIEEKCRSWGEEFRGKDKDKIGMSPEEKFISVYGEEGQAERLVQAKKSNQGSAVVNHKNNPGSAVANHRTLSNGGSKGILGHSNKTPIRHGTPGMKNRKNIFHR